MGNQCEKVTFRDAQMKLKYNTVIHKQVLPTLRKYKNNDRGGMIEVMNNHSKSSLGRPKAELFMILESF